MAAGGLWICLWRTRWRRWGLVPVAAGALWALLTPAPDLIVTGDGRHLALRTDDGRLRHPALPRRRLCPRHPGRGGRRRSRNCSTSKPCPMPPAATRSAPRPSNGSGRRWRLLATRSRDLVARPEMLRGLRRSGHRRRRPRPAARLQPALAACRPNFPAAHRRPLDHARQSARGRDGRGARRPASLGVRRPPDEC